MSIDIQKLKALAEACPSTDHLRLVEYHGSWYLRNEAGIVFTIHRNSGFPEYMAENEAYARLAEAASPAAVLELIAENERLQRFETAYKEFSDKTAWVIPSAETQELGMHVADILRKRCDDLTAHCQAQADEIVRLQNSLLNVQDSLDREYWCEYAGLDDTRDILNAAINPEPQS